MTLEVDLNNILIQGESEKVEFKSSFNKEVIETIVAFANKSGGVKLFAVTIVDDLLNNTYHSNPRNKLIADLFKDLGHIEKYGSGIKRIVNLFKIEQLPMPEFKNISGGFMVTVFNTTSIIEKIVEDELETVGETVGEILSLIRLKPEITRKELSEKLGLTIRGIEWNLQKMKQKGYIKRIGSTKSGYWQIVKTN